LLFVVIAVFLADNEVTCTITDPAKLLGMEASNGQDMNNYRDNINRVFCGRMLTYIQATSETGRITLRFTAPLLKPLEINL